MHIHMHTHAYTMHTPCIHRAYTVHTPCICNKVVIAGDSELSPYYLPLTTYHLLLRTYKVVIAGDSELSPGALPFHHAGCRSASGACGACLDGFALADCECDAGATEATFSRTVAAGELLQVAALTLPLPLPLTLTLTMLQVAAIPAQLPTN